MRKLAILLLFFISTMPLLAAPYEASALHNSVSRSETVLDLYFQRWTNILENDHTFDLFGRINWVNGFQIKTIDEGNGSKITVPMRLIRASGGISFLYPFSTTADENIGLIGFTTTGFHYGMTRSVSIERGTIGDESVTDYKYSQFFDDIYSLTFIYKPWIVLHAGIISNKAIEPNSDGTIDYFSDEGSNTKYFIATTIYSVVDFNFNIDRDKLETFGTTVNINDLYNLIFTKPIPYIPSITIGYKKVALFNDEIYNSVWVNSAKSGNDTKEKADLTTYSLLLEGTMADAIKLSFFTELQSASEKLIEKRTGETLNVNTIKELKGEISFNFFYDDNDLDLFFIFGMSNLWDPALAVHSDSAGRNSTGYNFAISFNMVDIFETDLRFIYNDSIELKKLPETVDKFAIEWGFNFSMDYTKLFKKKG